MNRNRKVRVASYGIAAGALAAFAAVGFGGADAQAAPLAGATAVVSTTAEVNETGSTDTDSSKSLSTVAGANQEIANIIAETNAPETEETEAESQEAENPADNIGIANIDNYVNVRSGAGEDNQVVGMLYSNNAAQIVGEENGWYQIESGNVAGYVKSDYLTVGDQQKIDEVTDKTATVNTGTLYVRNEASTDSEVLGFTAGGEELKVIDDSMASEGWVKVSTEAGEGYVSVDYINIESHLAVGETVQEYMQRIAEEEEADRKAEAAARAAQQRAQQSRQQRTQQPATRATNNYNAQASSAGAAQKTYSTAPVSGDGSAVASYASQFIGNPYVYGGTSLTNGTDCSGFVKSVYGDFGVDLPHSSSALRGVGTSVSASDMQPGDIVCYSGHVGIYAGDGNIVHASTPSSGIKVSDANYKTILDVRRVVQ